MARVAHVRGRSNRRRPSIQPDPAKCGGFFAWRLTMTLSEIRERAIAPALAMLPGQP